jgi:NAD(P)-dependent dehydrogenase (short-subunit alcohol dehydrogenase family)
MNPDTVALIIGARSAIGCEAACAFARGGSRLVLAGRNEAGGEALACSFVDRGAKAIFVRADITDEADVDRLVSATIDAYGRLDYAFNNAGGTYGVVGAITDVPGDAWDTVIGGNLKGLWFAMRHELRAMREIGSGAIVNTVGVLGMVAAPELALYTAAKHGAIGLTKAAALENAELGIRVNAIAPGSTRRYESPEDDQRRVRAAATDVPMRRLAEAREIGDAAAWLCSDAASFITGQVLVVDGGWLAKL